MRILFVADGRSPIALNWMRFFIEQGDEVFLASTFACQPPAGLKGFQFVPVAFSAARSTPAASAKATRRGRMWGAALLPARTFLRQWLGPLTLRRAAWQLSGFLRQAQPQLIHALRIPYEGMLASEAEPGPARLAISVWGNDFTLHAPASPLMRHYTQWALTVTDALHADCERDVRLARTWGLDARKPTLVTPGNGGIRREVFFPPAQAPTAPVVVHPRGFRAYVRNDTFFRALPLVLQRVPQAQFVCIGMAGESQAETWVRRLGLENQVQLLPALSPPQMAQTFRAAQVMVSPSTHDGTPNTLLEAMACGCLPVASNLESIWEWITPEENGLLVDASDPQALAEALVRGLTDEGLRRRAAAINAQRIASRGDYATIMPQVAEWYNTLV